MSLSLYIVYASVILSISNAYHSDSHWNYERDSKFGPQHWWNITGDEECGGIQQSPILIPRSHLLSSNQQCSQELTWNVDNTMYNWTANHNGHTIVLTNQDASNKIYLDNAYQFEGNNQHSKYILDSIHFHWGTNSTQGSENKFDDAITSLEIHLVHYSEDYDNVSDAIEGYKDIMNQSNDNDSIRYDQYTLAVVSQLFEETNDDDSEYIDESADYVIGMLATDESMETLWHNASGEAQLMFSLFELMQPADFMVNYFFFYGSLTTPPCTPNVRWHVSQNTMKLRSSTMDMLRESTLLWEEEEELVDTDENWRPLQSNPSCVWSCNNNDDMKVCPNDTMPTTTSTNDGNNNGGDGGKDDSDNIGLLWLWITIAVVGSLLIFVAVFCYVRKQRQESGGWTDRGQDGDQMQFALMDNGNDNNVM